MKTKITPSWSIRASIICTLAIGLFSTSAFACSCIWIESFSEHAQQSAFVFVGKAIAVDTVFSQNTGYSNSFTFAIEEPIKGVQGSEVKILSSGSSASCGYSFQLDSSYLVFAYQIQEDPSLWSGLCSGNQKLGDSAATRILAEVKSVLALNPILSKKRRDPKYKKWTVTPSLIQSRGCRLNGQKVKRRF